MRNKRVKDIIVKNLVEKVAATRTLKRILEVMKEKHNNVIICVDFNLPFIQWPQGSFEGRGSSRNSYKTQADLCY